MSDQPGRLAYIEAALKEIDKSQGLTEVALENRFSEHMVAAAQVHATLAVAYAQLATAVRYA